MNNAGAALRWLGAQPPNLDKARQALGRAVDDGSVRPRSSAASEFLIKKEPPRKDALEVNEAIVEVIALTRGEVMKNNVAVQTQLAEGLPLVQGDRVQLQQVILNLIINAVQAMSGVSEGSRRLLIGTGKDASGRVLVAVQDSGPGLNPESFERLFELILHHQARRHGHGAIDLPFDCRSSRGTHMGHPERRARHHRAIHCRSTIKPRHPRVRRRDLHYSEILPAAGEIAYPVLSNRRNIVVIADEAHRLAGVAVPGKHARR